MPSTLLSSQEFSCQEVPFILLNKGDTYNSNVYIDFKIWMLPWVYRNRFAMSSSLIVVMIRRPKGS